jgi:aspartate/methionine/tyrosine aminotransferase
VLLERNRQIVQSNLPRLEEFFDAHRGMFEWIRPSASPIGFPRVRGVGDVEDFCERLAANGVLLLPGTVYDEPDHVRVGFGRANLPEALAALESALAAPAAA